MSDPIDDGPRLGSRIAGYAALATALVGIGVLGLGVLDATPLVFFGTDEEYAAVDEGKELVWSGAGVLVLEGVLLGLARYPWLGAITMASALVCALVVEGADNPILSFATSLVAVVCALATGAYGAAND